MRSLLLFLAIVFLAELPDARADPEAVDVALVLAVDISASVDAREHRLQMTGIAAALQSKAVIDAIAAAPRKKIAITITQWSGLRVQRVVVPWTVIRDEETARRLAHRILSAPRADPGGATSLSLALEHAGHLFGMAPPATRRVIDISTDGINNIGPPLDSVRRLFGKNKITVNGLAITSEWPKLGDYLNDYVITGPAAFAVQAETFEAFGEAMTSKLLREIRGPGLS
jgi:hypothetical protein